MDAIMFPDRKIERIVQKELGFPESLSEIRYIKPSIIPIGLTARLKCFQCGLYKRAILCPPYLWLTYPWFATLAITRTFLDRFEVAVLLVWKNDGSKSWKIDKKELSHINLIPKKGKQLKGTEAGQSRSISQLMNGYRNIFKEKGYRAFALIPGHCDLCGHKCPNRDNPPCKHRGMPSLEAIGIDVYELLKKLGIEYEYPVQNYLTNVTMLLIRHKNN